MGKMGRAIDHLTDAQKDRIVRAQGWTPGAMLRRDGRRCLVGHIENRRPGPETQWMESRRGDYEFDVHQLWTGLAHRVSPKFDRLVNRFGLERIVRACKQRAAATMSDEVERKALPPAREVCTADPLNSLYSEV